MPKIQEVIDGIYARYKDMGNADQSLLATAIQEDARSEDVLVDVIFPQPDVLVVVRRQLTEDEAVSILDALTDDESARDAGDLILMWSVPSAVQDAYQRLQKRNLEDWAANG